MKWINLFEKQPKGEYGTIYSARQIFDKTDVNSYGELCLLEDRMVRYDDEEFQTDWAYAKNYEWLDEWLDESEEEPKRVGPDTMLKILLDEKMNDLKAKIEALPRYENIETSRTMLRLSNGRWIEREDVLNLLK